MRVLIVDDDIAFRRAVGRLLRADASVIAGCDTVEAAVDLLGVQPFDVVLLDVHMGDAPFDRALDAVARAARSAPIVVVTGGPRDGSEEQELARLPYRVLWKPFTRDELRAALPPSA